MKYTSINFLPDAKQSPVPCLPIRLFTSQHQLFTGASHLMANGKETQSPSISYFANFNPTWNQTFSGCLMTNRVGSKALQIPNKTNKRTPVLIGQGDNQSLCLYHIKTSGDPV